MDSSIRKIDLLDTRRLEDLAKLPFNFDAKTVKLSENQLGWKIDKHRAKIAQEIHGPPVPGGPFSKACQAVREYQFPDPHLITGVFSPEADLAGRNMLLKAHFIGMSFYFGVRIVEVFDQKTQSDDGHSIQQWGYAYRTLHGHFEIGEIRFIVSKDLTTGEVFFEIHSYSKPDRIPNFFYRIGFKIFGRPLQKYFAESSIKRMKILANTK